MTEKTDTLNHFELGYVKTGVKVNIFRKKISFSQYELVGGVNGKCIYDFEKNL